MTGDPHHDGLRTPHGPAGALERPRRLTPLRIAVQVLATLISLGLFGWAIALALSPENRASLEAVAHAAAPDLALLLGLTVASLIVNGLIFWVILLPARKLPATEVVLVNAIATVLILLPFKLSIAARVLIHHRRDGVPFRDLLAWFAAIGALGLAVLAPLSVAALWRREVDAWFLIAGPGLALAITAAGWGLAHLAQRVTLLHRLSLGGDRLIRDPVVPIAHYLLRMADVAMLAGRFYAAARIADVALAPEPAAILGCGYFLTTVITPGGVLGFAEIGTAGIGRLLDLPFEQTSFVVLIVTATQTAVAVAGSLIAVWTLRLDRLITGRRRRAHDAQEKTPAS